MTFPIDFGVTARYFIDDPNVIDLEYVSGTYTGRLVLQYRWIPAPVTLAMFALLLLRRNRSRHDNEM